MNRWATFLLFGVLALGLLAALLLGTLLSTLEAGSVWRLFP